MQEGKQRGEWEHTASMMSMIQNVNCTKTSKMKNADFFNPTIPEHLKRTDPGKTKTKNFYVLKNRLPNYVGTKRVK